MREWPATLKESSNLAVLGQRFDYSIKFCCLLILCNLHKFVTAILTLLYPTFLLTVQNPSEGHAGKGMISYIISYHTDISDSLGIGA